MTTWQSAVHGVRTSADYFVSTFLFGVMFGITAVSVGLEILAGAVDERDVVHRLRSVCRARILEQRHCLWAPLHCQ